MRWSARSCWSSVCLSGLGSGLAELELERAGSDSSVAFHRPPGSARESGPVQSPDVGPPCLVSTPCARGSRLNRATRVSRSVRHATCPLRSHFYRHHRRFRSRTSQQFKRLERYAFLIMLSSKMSVASLYYRAGSPGCEGAGN